MFSVCQGVAITMGFCGREPKEKQMKVAYSVCVLRVQRAWDSRVWGSLNHGFLLSYFGVMVRGVRWFGGFSVVRVKAVAGLPGLC